MFLTLLLATVGYKFIVSTWMPVKPYLTIIDKYVITSFLFQGMTIAESVFVVWMWCKPIQDDDSEQDGIYNGRYKMRTPPDRECSEFISDVEFWFTMGAFVPWAIINLSLLTCPKHAIRFVRWCLNPCTWLCLSAHRGKSRWDIGLRSWEELYEQEKTLTAMDVPEASHRYGVRPSQDASMELPNLLACGEVPPKLKKPKAKFKKKKTDVSQRVTIDELLQ